MPSQADMERLFIASHSVDQSFRARWTSYLRAQRSRGLAYHDAANLVLRCCFAKVEHIQALPNPQQEQNVSAVLSQSRIRASLALLAAGAVFALSILATSEAPAARKGRKTRRDPPDASVGAPVVGASPSLDGGVSQRNQRNVAPAGGSNGIGCYYGSQIDGHSGKETCLAPEQLNPPLHVLADTRHLAEQLGMLGPDSGTDAQGDHAVEPGADSDDETDAGDDGVSGQYKARVVSVSFENGAVGKAFQSLKRLKHEMAACVANEGGLKAQSARLKLMFLVRPRGRAEGIIVSSARNVPPKVVRCITKLVETHSIGTPSNDPVGVTALIELKERE